MAGKIIALDIATTVGFAIDGPEEWKPLTGTVRFAADGDDFGRAYVGFEKWLTDLIGVQKPDIMAFEAPLIVGGPRGTTRPTNANTVRLLFGLAAVAEMVGSRAGLRVFECHIQTVRRHFVGNGRCQKPEVRARCKLLGWDVQSNDAADAAAIWDFARSQFRPSAAHRTTPLFAAGGAR